MLNKNIIIIIIIILNVGGTEKRKIMVQVQNDDAAVGLRVILSSNR